MAEGRKGGRVAVEMTEGGKGAKGAGEPRAARGKIHPGLLLELGLALVVLGMSLVVLGVIAGPVFLIGVYILIAGMLLIASAGILYVIPRYADGART
jgi:hypothetical protein